jgi:hypothetical protein
MARKLRTCSAQIDTGIPTLGRSAESSRESRQERWLPRLIISLAALVIVAAISAPAAMAGHKSLVYERTAPGGNPEIWAVDEDGSNDRKLADGHSPTLNDDGRKVAYISAPKRGESAGTGTTWRLELVDIDGSNPRTACISPTYMGQPEFEGGVIYIEYSNPLSGPNTIAEVANYNDPSESRRRARAP